MKNTFKILIIWLLLGMTYYMIEGIWRIPKGGVANICMLSVGGLCGVLVGVINQIKFFYKMKIVWQSLIGTILVTLVEFVFGYIINIKFKMHVWDYSNLPLNIKGQVCLLYSGLWFLLMPACIWLEDKIRYVLWNEGDDYSLLSIYKDLITYK